MFNTYTEPQRDCKTQSENKPAGAAAAPRRSAATFACFLPSTVLFSILVTGLFFTSVFCFFLFFPLCGWWCPLIKTKALLLTELSSYEQPVIESVNNFFIFKRNTNYIEYHNPPAHNKDYICHKWNEFIFKIASGKIIQLWATQRSPRSYHIFH